MSTDLVTLAPAMYPALDPTNDRVQTLLANLGGEELSVADFNRIKVPAGGGTKWQIETAAGTEVVDAIEGVILHIAPRRAYWSNPNPTNEPPDCASTDMIIGIGQPGGTCKACPFYQFGSGKNGRGKACKETRLVFVLRAEQVLPDVLAIPPASLKELKKYLLRLDKPKSHVITRFALEAAKNGDGINYAKVTCKTSASLDADSVAGINVMLQQYESTFNAVVVDYHDVGGDTEEV